MANIFIIAGKRTPFGAFGGALKQFSATDLAAHACKAAVGSAQLDPKLIDDVYIGNVAQTSVDAAYLSRHASLRAGVPLATPALTVNRLCGSGFQSVVNAAQVIKLGEASVVLTGGTESMSQAPMASYTARWGSPLGSPMKFVDTLMEGLTDSGCKLPMAITAENLAVQYGITRDEVDAYAARSQRLWGEANAAGVFEAEMAPVTLKTKKGESVMDMDEHPKPQTTAEGLAKLKPVFKADGIVTAGGASGICDGAAASVVASEEAVTKHGLKPLARVVAYFSAGVDPTVMGIGPVPAITGALKIAGLTLKDMDIVEINEAFAAQVLACQRELGIDDAVFNRSGGAIALGHPLGASGARIVNHVAHRLAATGKRYGIGAACIGGGQGIAVILENAQ